MEILECLQNDHDAIRALLIELQTSDAGVEVKRLIFNSLSTLVESHTRAEEMAVLSYTCRDEAMRAMTLESLEEHDLCEALASSIPSTKNEDVWEARVKVYSDFLEQHLAEQERCLFPELYDRLTEEQRTFMAQTYMKVRNTNDVIVIAAHRRTSARAV